MNNINRTICPDCSSPRVAPILYGYPTSEAVVAAQNEELILAGCIVTGNDPTQGCFACGSTWGSFEEEVN